MKPDSDKPEEAEATTGPRLQVFESLPLEGEEFERVERQMQEWRRTHPIRLPDSNGPATPQQTRQPKS
jgi:hypothetical protein